MSVLLAFAAAFLFASGTYLLLQRRLSRILIGVGLIGHGSNILLLTSGTGRGVAPLIGTADPTVLPDMARQMYDAATAAERRDLHFVKGGTHYFENQPDLLAEALDVIAAWLSSPT